MQPPKVLEISQLVGLLDSIWTLKRALPDEYKDWVDILGLYVNLVDHGKIVELRAGGKYISYFIAYSQFLCLDASDWKINKYNKETWANRFAHLVHPTREIALYVGGSPNKPPCSQFDENAINILENAIKQMNSTGDWPGLFHKKCASCSCELMIWEWLENLCPHCHGEKGKWSWD